MELKDLGQVSKLHIEAIPYSINSKMGSRRVENLYKECLGNSDFLSLVAVSEGNIVAFISGTKDFSSLSHSAIKSLKLGDLIVLLRHSTPKALFLDLMDSFSVSRNLNKNFKNSFILTSWGSDRQISSQVPAAGVYISLIEECKILGITEMVADVRKTNISVANAYLRIGFQIYKTTPLSQIFLLKI